MECRLCLCTGPTLSINENIHLLSQRIRTCCQLQIKKGDRLPDTICLTCINTLESFSSFRKTCRQNDKMSKRMLNSRLKMKRKKVLIKDLWNNESDMIVGDVHSFAYEMNDIIGPKENSSLDVFICDICSKSYFYKSAIEGHLMFHTEDKSDKHNICLKPSTDIFNLRYFNAIKDSTDSQIKCYPKNLHKCNICSKLFFKKSNLHRHMTCHTSEKIFKCNHCDKTFTLESYLCAHVKYHTKEKQHKCNICLKAFTLKSSLTIHMRYHTGEKPYQCDICFKSFSIKGNRDAHVKSHTGIKPYSCNVCSKTFALKRYLVTHMKFHVREKQIEECETMYPRLSALMMKKNNTNN